MEKVTDESNKLKKKKNRDGVDKSKLLNEKLRARRKSERTNTNRINKKRDSKRISLIDLEKYFENLEPEKSPVSQSTPTKEKMLEKHCEQETDNGLNSLSVLANSTGSFSPIPGCSTDMNTILENDKRFIESLSLSGNLALENGFVNVAEGISNNSFEVHSSTPLESNVLNETQNINLENNGCNINDIQNSSDNVIIIDDSIDFSSQSSKKNLNHNFVITETIDLTSDLPNKINKTNKCNSLEIIIVNSDTSLAESSSNNNMLHTRRVPDNVSNHKNLGDCPICFDSLNSKMIASTMCGHIFCMQCIEQAQRANSFKKCPTCRKTLKSKNSYHQIFI